MVDDGGMAWRDRLARRRRGSAGDELEQRMATGDLFASQLTETGSRCHLNDGSTRFCHWRATELDEEFDDAPAVGVRCTIHPGGRSLDSSARLDLADLA
jgi:hypothetical protein